MCIEDIAISRRSYKRVTSIQDSVPVNLPANPDRLSVRVMVPLVSGVAATISDTQANALSTIGYKAARYNDNGISDMGVVMDLMLSYKDDGPAVQDAMSISVTGSNSYIVETLMMPELAQAVNERLNSLRAR